MLLVGLWAVANILLPRVAPDIALAAKLLPTRLENDIAIQRDLRATGDSHNPDDPYFAAFKAKVLKQNGVARVEDLPVNYRGLLAVEGEKLTSKMFDTYASAAFAQQNAQSNIVDSFAILSPAIALRRLSMATAGYQQQLSTASYVTARLNAGYQISENISVHLDADNLTNAYYLESSFGDVWVTPGAPRSIKG